MLFPKQWGLIQMQLKIISASFEFHKSMFEGLNFNCWKLIAIPPSCCQQFTRSWVWRQSLIQVESEDLSYILKQLITCCKLDRFCNVPESVCGKVLASWCVITDIDYTKVAISSGSVWNEYSNCIAFWIPHICMSV